MRLQLLCASLLVTAVLSDELTVRVKQGALRGHLLMTRNGREYRAFQGIPYGKPPIGELRFKRSLPADSWEGIKNVTRDGNECIQKDYSLENGVKGDEDCLYINVYTPKWTGSSLLPVMVWIHGGDWLQGSGSSLLYGGNYLLDKDVVYVALNYRLGPLGFMSTGDDLCPGNNGLKDQVLALHWVQNNIKQFSGDPSRVTLFGNSVGGVSVHLHTLSPMSKGLFHGAIAQSGVALAPWAYASRKVATNLAVTLATRLNCSTQTSVEMLKCMRERDASAIFHTADIREWNGLPYVMFRPVKESGTEAFLPDDPSVLLGDPSRVTSVPFMSGITSAEGGIFAASVFGTPRLVQELSDDFNKVMPMIMFYRETSPDPDYVTRRIKQYYFQDNPITNDSRRDVTDMFSDGFIGYQTDRSVRLHANTTTAPTYFYYFDYKPPVSYSTILVDPSGADYGVCHCDELQFLFPHDTRHPGAALSSDNDQKVLDLILTMWINFATTGNPTPDDQQVRWNPVTSTQLEYLHVQRDGHVVMSHSLLQERMRFWEELTSHSQGNMRDEL